jgi:hypothetical protein
MKGGSIYDLKELLGHSDVATSMRYAHLAPSHLKAQASLEQFLPNVPGKVVELTFAKHFPNIGGENDGKTELLTMPKNQNRVVRSDSFLVFTSSWDFSRILTVLKLLFRNLKKTVSNKCRQKLLWILEFNFHALPNDIIKFYGFKFGDEFLNPEGASRIQHFNYFF